MFETLSQIHDEVRATIKADGRRVMSMYLCNMSCMVKFKRERTAKIVPRLYQSSLDYHPSRQSAYFIRIRKTRSN